MRILYFSREYTTHDYRFLAALAATQHKVGYLRLERQGQVFEDRSLPAEIEVISWRGGRSPVGLWQGLRLLPELRDVIRRFQPDLIQAGPLQRSAFMVALTGFRPLLSMSWGYDLIHDVHRGPLWRWATRFTLRRSSVMVGDCDTIRNLAISFGMPNERIVTFPWGIDVTHFSPGDPASSPKWDLGPGKVQPFTLISTRSWEPLYGVDLIAEAFSRAAVQRPELRLIMLGNGSQAAHLHEIFKNYGVQERVNFPGLVTQAELPDFYRRANLYVSASHSDGTSISMLEAMACGKPVLVSDIPGNGEWVTGDENGWLFPDSDADTLAQRILYAVDNRLKLHDMGFKAWKIARERADWRVNFQVLLQAYELALAVEKGRASR